MIATVKAAGIDGEHDGRLWIQLERGYDCAAILATVATSLNRFTVRGVYNRAVWVDQNASTEDASASHRNVQDALDAAMGMTTYKLAIEASSAHP